MNTAVLYVRVSTAEQATEGLSLAAQEARLRAYCAMRGLAVAEVVIDAGVKIPAGLVVGEDPVADAKRFRRTDAGICLITQPMIDRLAA